MDSKFIFFLVNINALVILINLYLRMDAKDDSKDD